MLRKGANEQILCSTNIIYLLLFYLFSAIFKHSMFLLIVITVFVFQDINAGIMFCDFLLHIPHSLT